MEQYFKFQLKKLTFHGRTKAHLNHMVAGIAKTMQHTAFRLHLTEKNF
jgi:hypothetical protein